MELHGLEMFETVTMDNARKWYPQLLPTLKLIGDGFSNIADGYRKPDVSPRVTADCAAFRQIAYVRRLFWLVYDHTTIPVYVKATIPGPGMNECLLMCLLARLTEIRRLNNTNL